MTRVAVDVERERQLERHIMGTIIAATSGEVCGRDLAILANVCPPPLGRWFAHDPLVQVLAVCADQALAGTISTNPDSLLALAAKMPHSACLDLRQGKPARAWNPCDYAESALANAGGYPAVADLQVHTADFVGVRGVVANAPLLRNAGVRRRIIEELRQMAQSVAASDLAAGPGDAVAAHQDRVMALMSGGGERNMGDCLREALDAGKSFAAMRERGQAPAATWGIPALDALVPMRAGGLYILAAAPKAGKTSLALQAATAVAADAGHGAVAIGSLEMSGAELATIVAGRKLGIAPAAIRERSQAVAPELWERLDDLAVTWRASASVLVRDAAGVSDRITAEGFTSWLTQRRNASPRMSLAVLDYLQLLDATNPRATEYDRITSATRQLKRAAMSLRLPLLVLSQMNRAGRAQVKDRAGAIVGDPEPTLADLRGSGSIEQDADAVVFLHKIGKPDPNASAILVRATVAANRAGPEGTVDLWFHRRQQLFEEAVIPGAQVDVLRERSRRMAAKPNDSEGVFP